MRVSREQADKNREHVIDVASRLFRERGFEGIGVADLMKEAGLTHGGFYGHFSSKESLVAEASARALMRSLTALSQVAALGPDVSRQGPAVRRSVTDFVRGAVDLLTTMARGNSKAARRQKALSTY